MRTLGMATGLGLLALVAGTSARDEPSKSDAPSNHWKDAASNYRISLEAGRPTLLTLRAEPALKWTNPLRRADDGAVFVWTDRGRPEVAASFFRYRSDGKPFEDHEFVSLSTSPLSATREGEPVWSVAAGNVQVAPIPDAPRPASTPNERLRQMRALAREFRANFNNPPDLSEIRLLTQPIYRFETESKRTDILDGALFAFVHTTDPEVLLAIEARPPTDGGPMAWHYSIARMSLVNLRAFHKDRQVWSAEWVQPARASTKPYMVRSYPSGE
jgi:hypothetical protein